MTLWGGHFPTGPDPAAWALNASIAIDQRLAGQDIRGSIAWARALANAGVLSEQEADLIIRGLTEIRLEFDNRTFNFLPTDEDIHTAVERRLGEKIGAPAGKLHTGRSRNDQVATDFRLWVMEQLPSLEITIGQFQSVLLQRAKGDMGVILPGYTHTQRAQPILLSHWWLSHFWAMQRDRQRLKTLWENTAVLPLGSGALAGTTFPIDRQALALDLGFTGPSQNSLDAVSDWDFAVELLFWSSLTGVHLSRLADAIILYTSAEFGFMELTDAYSTGSSLMPQKKNPDVFELTRGKTGTLIGLLTGLLATLKGLPSAYDKDLQEDKAPAFTAVDTVMAILPVMAGAINSLAVHPDRMSAAIDSSMMATDIADYLVKKGIPFRQAYTLVGKAIRLCANRKISLNDLTPADWQDIHPSIESDVLTVLDPVHSINYRSVIGGTAQSSVEQQIKSAQDALEIRSVIQI